MQGADINDHQHSAVDDVVYDHEYHDHQHYRPGRYHVDVYDYDFHLGRINDPPHNVHLDDGPCLDDDCRRYHVFVATRDDLFHARDYALGFFYDDLDGRPEHVVDKLVAGLIDEFHGRSQAPGDRDRRGG